MNDYKDLHVQIPIELFKALKINSAENDKSLKKLVIDVLSEYIERENDVK